MPNWYAEDDDGHLRCYFDDDSGHELCDCAASHAASHAKWERQRNMKPLPEWLQEIADARVWTLDAQQAYYDRDEDDRDEDDYDDYWGFFGPDGP